jgi:hypothetical protein
MAEDRKSLIEEVLPYDAPDDLVLVASSRIHDAVVERVQLARADHPAARALTDLGARARRIVASLSPGIIGDIGEATSATVSIRDHLVNVAAVSSAPLVTDDEILAPREYTLYRHEDGLTGRPTFAIRSWTFIDRQIDCAPFSLDDISFNALEVALQQV